MTKGKYIKKILIALIVILNILDFLMAWKYSSFLETNIISIKLGFGWLVLFKIIFMFFVIYIIHKNSYKNEAALFSMSAAFIMMILLFGFGAFSGVRGSQIYEEGEAKEIEEYKKDIIEQTGEAPPPAQVEQYVQQIREETRQYVEKVAIPYYVAAVWQYGIYPFIYAIISFAVYERLLESAKLRKRRQNIKKDEKIIIQ
jgi:hypothetical protein